jgi:Leucine-rich repeat (LRR) protein
MSGQLVSHVLLPRAWLALLFQHVASGPGGIAHAAALSQTCKFLRRLSEGTAVTYRNLSLAPAIRSPDHAVWQWLAKRSGRVAGLKLELRIEVLDGDSTPGDDQLPDWMQPLQTLSGFPDVQLRVEWVGSIADADHPCIVQWLKQHGQLISHMTVQVHISEGRLKLKDFSEAAAHCTSIDLTISHPFSQVVDLADLAPVAGSLQLLSLELRGGALPFWAGSLRSASALSSMPHLTTLDLDGYTFGSEEPWGVLAKLTRLRVLSLTLYTTGDPSPLSALTGLSVLDLESSSWPEMGDLAPFSFSSLQPLSTMEQLNVLYLTDHACDATSLQGLAALSRLTLLELGGGRLRSLEGISNGLSELTIESASDLLSLAGVEGCTGMEKLYLGDCGASSLQPLSGLSSIKEFKVCHGKLTSLEGLNSTSLQSLSLMWCDCLFQLSGVEHLSALKSLEVDFCGVTSLQPLSQLGEGLQKLNVMGCPNVQDEVLELPNVQPTASIYVNSGSLKEVVLAGGVRMSRL